MKIYVTPEISPLISRMLRKLSQFEEADIVFANDLLRTTHRNFSLIESIYLYRPVLLITRNDNVVHAVRDIDAKVKIVWLRTRDHDTNEKFWLNAYHMEGFLHSRDRVLEMQ